MLLGDPKVSVNDSLRRDPPQADNDLGTEEGGLRPKIADTGFLLYVQRISVPRWTTFYNVGNVDPLPG